MDNLAVEIDAVIQQGLKDQLTIEEICEVYRRQTNSRRSRHIKWCLIFFAILAVCLGCILSGFTGEEFSDLASDLTNVLYESDCMIEHNEFTSEVIRPVFDCSTCKGLLEIPREKGLTKEKFEELYAFTGSPVLVEGGASNWTAQAVYSVNFFKELYSRDNGTFEKLDDQCQFMPYYTEWLTLKDALNMPEDMAALKSGRWYIGWSNCLEDIEQELRKYYSKPAFLPDSGGTVHMDWIFMGGSGVGAPLHLDMVGRPSWQAQLRGQKTWTLEPSPECDHICSSFKVHMHPGDIIVLDTDRWYHSTFIHPGEISITVGSEYD